MSETEDDTTEWSPWQVVPDSGFEVLGPTGQIGLRQISATDFLVDGVFRFSDDPIEKDLIKNLAREGKSEAEARELVDRARVFRPSESPTNLASVPPFMRWFESSYGRHTLAALIHDELIGDEANGGALNSDTLADRFFRQMLGASGLPFVKRWIMWGAVALRTRWAAKGRRQASLVLWVLAAVVGISLFSVALAWSIADGGVPGTAWVLMAVALVLPVLSAPLWGRQWGASLVAAVAGAFVIPAAGFVVLGLAIYWTLEKFAALLGRK